MIAIGLGILGIGTTNVVFALVVLAAPVILTNAYVAIDGVEPEAVEAARGMECARCRSWSRSSYRSRCR